MVIMCCLVPGSILCGVGFLSAIVVSFLDIRGVAQLGQDSNLKMSSKNVVSDQIIVNTKFAPII